MFRLGWRYSALISVAAAALVAALYLTDFRGKVSPEEGGSSGRLPEIQEPAASKTLGEKSPPAPQAQIHDGTPRPAPYQGEALAALNPDPAFLAKIPPETASELKRELETLARSVGEQPQLFEDWLRIGFIKKFFNNYRGTRDAWEHAKLVEPRDSRAWFNLGALYASYLNEPALAEAHLKAAIRLDPIQAGYPAALADFYRHSSPPRLREAEQVILNAIAKLPRDPDLHTYLAELYATEGQTPQAIAEYEKALALLGPAALAHRSAIEARLGRLRR